jgi:type IV pilus assembly protein PilQ
MFILTGLAMFLVSAGAVFSAPADPAATEAPGIQQIREGSLQNIAFERLRGKERVVLMLSGLSGALAEDLPGNIVLIKIDGFSVPKKLQRPLGEGELDNLIRVVPAQKTDAGKQQATVRMELNKAVPYRIGQEGPNIIVDFNVASLPVKAAAVGRTVAVREPARKPAPAVQTTGMLPGAPPSAEREKYPKGKPAYLTQPISFEFQDAPIKGVLKTLADVAGINIVYGDDVKGNLTVSLNKIPWEQALDTVLAINDMTRIQEGSNIIRVITKNKLGELEKKAEDREKKEQQKKVDLGQLKQISIEAKIVEAATGFVRSLGVQWGGAYANFANVGKSSYPYGVIAGTNPSSAGSTGLGTLVPVADGMGITSTGLAANLPTALASPTLGIVVGTANAIITAQLSALETTSEGRIISSPRVVIMEGEEAVIKQGEEIPVITPATATQPATVTYKPAELELKVIPKITEDGRISMSINALNNRANKAEKEPTTGNMPIWTNNLKSKVVIRDGDTIVIGGVMKTEEQKGVSGVPWIQKVPILGWLFKTEDIDRTKRELLIFVTPRILNTAAL